MNSTISTNDDLLELQDELLRLQLAQSVRVCLVVSDFMAKKLLQGAFQTRRFRNVQSYEKGGALLQILAAQAQAQGTERFLVIYDLETSDKNGLELLALARKPGAAMKNVQVVLVTGAISATVRAKLIAAGANGVLERPISQESLLECLKELRVFL